MINISIRWENTNFGILSESYEKHVFSICIYNTWNELDLYTQQPNCYKEEKFKKKNEIVCIEYACYHLIE